MNTQRIRVMYSITLGLLFILTASACTGAPAVPPAASASPTAATFGGVLQGVVYNDLNQNGQIDPGEKPLEQVTVSESGCGSDQTAVTGVDGVFEFSGLTPSSSCTIQAIRAGWIFSGSYPKTGYPLAVLLASGQPTVISIYLAPASAVAAVTAPQVPAASPLAPIETLAPTPLATSTAAAGLILSAPSLIAKDININCLYGPGNNYGMVGVLVKGLSVPIKATNADGTWWEIDNPWSPGRSCWVDGAYTLTSGDTTQLTKVGAPTGLVTKISLSGPSLVHGVCGTKATVTITGMISTNGPADVTYHWGFESPGGYNQSAMPDQTINIPYDTTVTITQNVSRDCGNFIDLLVVTSPNSKTGQIAWEVVQP
jgi:hypothetical protein